MWIVGSYFHYAVDDGFEPPVALDISPRGKGPFAAPGDPMYVVEAVKRA